MKRHELDLFGAGQALPEGFRYQPEVISPDEEQGLVQRVRELPLREFQFQGYVGKRRVVSYGWQYDFNDRKLRQADDIPPWLLPLRESAARFAGLAPDQLQQALVTEYDVGAAIGWHRDKAVFGDVIGVSLLSPCRFRLRREVGRTWERVAHGRTAVRLSASGSIADRVGAQHSGGGRASLLHHVSQLPYGAAIDVGLEFTSRAGLDKEERPCRR